MNKTDSFLTDVKYKYIKTNTQGIWQFIGLGYVGPKQAGW